MPRSRPASDTPSGTGAGTAAGRPAPAPTPTAVTLAATTTATATASTNANANGLDRYWAKRDFNKTPEPRGTRETRGQQLAFVIQKHAASRLHYDFRLEWNGVMMSWAVPKGPSYDPSVKRMAVQVEDHPISYNSFEGTIPKGQYGAGTVIVWDRGTWEPLADPSQGLIDGKLVFRMHGEKMAGLWELIRIRKPGQERQDPWLLFKKHDEFERPTSQYDVVTAWPDSVIAKPLGDKAVASRATATKNGAAAAAAVPVKASSRASSPASGSASDEASDEAPSETPGRSPNRKAQHARTGNAGRGRGHDLPVGALKAELPARLPPQLATLATGVPSKGDWIYEIKFDGYRIMTRIDAGKPVCITRGGHDWSAKLPRLVDDLTALGLGSAWLDGEIVVLGADGIPDFNALQNAFDVRSTDAIDYFLFDVPFFEGHDLRQVPLRERRQLLKGLLAAKETDHLRFSADFEGDAASVLASACRMKLEGIIAKQADAPYSSVRTESWLKLKCIQRQEFVVGGFTDRGLNADAAEVGSLLLGVHDDAGRLVAAGNVGTGWNSATAVDLKTRLLALETPDMPFAGVPKRGRWSTRGAGSERWVRPELVAEVAFAEWTPDGHVRHARFVGLRTDKPAREIRRETATEPPRQAPGQAPPAAPAGAARPRPAAAQKISNPERVIDPSTGLTKLDLVRYYESVADFMLPHLVGRPCSLVRGPSGIGGELFFQKHAEKLRIPDVRDLPAAIWPGHEPLLEVPTAKALAGSAQMNVIEFHTWNASVKNIAKPDRLIFDIDPGEGVPWKQVQEAAVLTRAVLRELGLLSWLKTSGGKGLHVVVPLARSYGWEASKGFSQAVVQHLAKVIPQRFVAKSGPSNRIGRIFVDYLRNGHGATTAAAFSARARPGLGVSMPVTWEALDALTSGAQWTIATAREHLSFQTVDPWAAYWTTRQPLTAAMKRLGYQPPKDG